MLDDLEHRDRVVPAIGHRHGLGRHAGDFELEPLSCESGRRLGQFDARDLPSCPLGGFQEEPAAGAHFEQPPAVGPFSEHLEQRGVPRIEWLQVGTLPSITPSDGRYSFQK